MGRGSGDQAPTPAGWANPATLRDDATAPAPSAPEASATIAERPRERYADFPAEIRRRVAAGLAVRDPDTYHVRPELKKLGCIWARFEQAWLAPDAEALDAANQACSGYRARLAAVQASERADNAGRLAEQLAAEGREIIGDNSVRTQLHRQPEVGEVIALSEYEPDRRYVVEEVGGSHYHSEDECEDMDCFCGHYGRRWSTVVREVSLTDDERGAVEERERRAAAVARAGEVWREVQSSGEHPEGQHVPLGEQLLGAPDIYGGGSWFVVGDGTSDGQEWIWAVRNNGGDGDSWGWNNVATGGAGALGRRVPWSAELAAEIKSLAATAGDAARLR